jgi:DNA-binding NarL/FixJ family response regulator
VRERLAEIINREADLTVCGEAEERHEALAAISAKRPDLAIIDLTLKNSDGMELIKDIRSRWPKLRMNRSTRSGPSAPARWAISPNKRRRATSWWPSAGCWRAPFT